MLPNGKAIRLNTYIDIPVEIGLPYFIKDDGMEEEGPIYGNFKLSLQAVVCHQGNSVDSGHYIALVRSTTPVNDHQFDPSSHSRTTTSGDASQHWMRFDDLAKERITLVDIEKALKDESPYLLFYQILPIDADPETEPEQNPPSYEDSEAGRISFSKTSFNATGSDTSQIETDLEENSRNLSILEMIRSDNSSSNLAPYNFNTARTKAEEAHSSTSASPRSSMENRSRGRSRSPLGRTSLDPLVMEKNSENVAAERDNRENESGKRDRSKIRRLEKDKPKEKERQEDVTTPKKEGKKPDRECVVM